MTTKEIRIGSEVVQAAIWTVRGKERRGTVVAVATWAVKVAFDGGAPVWVNRGTLEVVAR